MSKFISIITPCYNEEQNVEILANRITAVMAELPQYDYELIFIDNHSSDGTVAKLRELAAKDKRIKAIINVRNFGHLRSPFHALMQARGEAVIGLSSDLQDPPELIPKLLEEWENGAPLVAAVKQHSETNPLVHFIRTLYYRTLNAMADVQLIEHFTGFGLYDRTVVEHLRAIGDRYPYLRGMVSELGFPTATVPFVQPRRKYGRTKLNLYHLYDFVMLGLTSHSVVPMRIATIVGLIMAVTCGLVALFYLVYKLVFWNAFSVGTAPIVIGIFAVASVQLMFIGLLGEYIGAGYRQLQNRPLVVEAERINFGNARMFPDSAPLEQSPYADQILSSSKPITYTPGQSKAVEQLDAERVDSGNC